MEDYDRLNEMWPPEIPRTDEGKPERVSDRADSLVGCGSIKDLRLLHLTLSVPVSGGPMVDVHIIKKAMDAVKELIQFRELLHELKIDAPNASGEAEETRKKIWEK